MTHKASVRHRLRLFVCDRAGPPVCPFSEVLVLAVPSITCSDSNSGREEDLREWATLGPLGWENQGFLPPC